MGIGAIRLVPSRINVLRFANFIRFRQDAPFRTLFMKMIRVFLLGLVVAFNVAAKQKLPNILWITSEDNGPELGAGVAGPFRGYKFSIYEGAFRVPFVVRWPGVVKPTRSCDQTIGLIDLMATLGEVTGADITDSQRPDSISFLPLLKDPQVSGARGSIFLQGTHGNAFRDGDWKIAFCPGSGAMGKWGNTPIPAKAWSAAVQAYGTNPKSHRELAQSPFVQLFNLAQDPGEANNLAAKHPERVTKMVAAAQTLIDRGRSTRGPALKNDRKSVLFKSVPKSVWGK